MRPGENEASKEDAERERIHDRIISVILASIWVGAAYYVYRSDSEIPASMLIIATIFFIMLVPAMKELVKMIDRRVKIQLGIIEPADE
ncbi:MAG: hypothetical protein R3192_13820 [Woeseiaceae bacterium]|nr:hypothetical protein [Woeseiaceae bacterium]